MKFLLEGERGWCGASRLFDALVKLGIDPALYTIEVPYVFSAQELDYYLDSLENELWGKERNDYYLYIKQICGSLRKWTNNGYIVHVVS